ncbi:MAG: NTP transferase domain-containing protein [Bryobacteraceae bacterium]
MRTCAVIPAAGKGSRLGLDRPKILAPIDGPHTVWSILHEKLRPLVDHVQLVLSPDGSRWFDPMRLPAGVSVVVQDEPRGMGDAVFTGEMVWSRFDRILVVWGDQVNLSVRTISECLERQASAGKRGVAFPLVELERPYVQYDFGAEGRLDRIRQTREGDQTDARGWSDVGLFALSTTGLTGEWKTYLSSCDLGSKTAEVNFLPFLVHLARAGWRTRTFVIEDAAEARGVNTPEDLEFARRFALATV